MEIKTKYNIGDEVWIKFVGMPIKSQVYEIIGGEKKLYRCAFYLSSSVYREDELFPTKEELLKSLQPTIKYRKKV